MFAILASLTASARRNIASKKQLPGWIPFPFEYKIIREGVVIGQNGLSVFPTIGFTLKPLGIVPKGSLINITGSYPIRGMLRVQYENITGYACAQYIQIITNIKAGKKIAQAAQDAIGCPFVYGMAGPKEFDNDGLVFHCHKVAGIQIPRSSAEMKSKGRRVVAAAAQTGDIVVFTRSGKIGIVTEATKKDVTYVAVFSTGEKVQTRKCKLAPFFFRKIQLPSSTMISPVFRQQYTIIRFW